MPGDEVADASPAAPAASTQYGGAGFTTALIAIALLAGGLVAYATREGLGLSIDSATYLETARHLQTGRGFTVAGVPGHDAPVTHFPPLYPATLAAMGHFGIDLLVAGRALNVAMMAGSILLAGVILHWQMRLSRRAALLGAAILAVAVDLLQAHAMAWSEAIFIFLVLASLALLGSFLDHHRRRSLIGCALAAAAALMVRYAALGLVFACCMALFVAHDRPRMQRLRDMLIFLVISCFPLGGWIVRNMMVGGSAANRQLFVHIPTGEAFEVGAGALATWLWPTSQNWQMWTGLGVVLLFLGVANGSARNSWKEGRRDHPIDAVLLCFAVAYLTFVLISITFFDAHTPLDSRILAPLHVAIGMWVFAELARSSLPEYTGVWRRVWKGSMITVGAAMVASQALRAGIWAHQAPDDAIGYATRDWRDSDLLHYLERLPPDALVYTNGRAAVRLRTGREVRALPGTTDLGTLEPVADFDRKIRRLRNDLRQRNGYIFYFRPTRRKGQIREGDLITLLRLQRIYVGRDGNIYQLEGSTTKTTAPATMHAAVGK